MKRAQMLLPALFASALIACNNAQPSVASGELTGPSGLTVTSGGDRDLLFIANEGHNNLRVLEMCNKPLLSDGGVDPADTCPATQDFQFLPAPIRVFPGTIETGDRPRRLAGVRLTTADGKPSGAVLVAGTGDKLIDPDAGVLQPVLEIVDAPNLIAAQNGTAAAKELLNLVLPAPAADVVAENPVDSAGVEGHPPAGTPGTAFAVTVAAGATVDAQLIMLSVGLDAANAVAAPTITGSCSLGAVVPRKIAVIPGGGDRVYVADGGGDGMVSILKSTIPAPANPPAPCVMTRIPAGGRATRSVAVSPQWFEGATVHPAGEFVVMVLEPLPNATPGQDLDTGGVLIVRTSDNSIVPVPPYGINDTSYTRTTDGGVISPLPAIEPIAPPGIPREITFLRAIPPGGDCPAVPASDGGVPGACTPLYVGSPSDSPTHKYRLLAVITSTDGGSYFLDVLARRLITTTYFDSQPLSESPTLTSSFVLSPSSSDPFGPGLALVPPLTVGVTHTELWRVIWHSPLPGLESRSASLTHGAAGRLLLQFHAAVNLQAWIQDPALTLGAGDVVSFTSYTPLDTKLNNATPACFDLAANESGAPNRFSLRINAILDNTTLELDPLNDSNLLPFNFDACPDGLGVTAVVRTAGTEPWLVVGGGTVRGRTHSGGTFVATEKRFDYPLDACTPSSLGSCYDPELPPDATQNVAISFTLAGNDPIFPGTGWSWSVGSGLDPVNFRDSTSGQGLATMVTAYSSPRHEQLVFSAITGQNTVLQADPRLLIGDINGIIAYR